MNLLNGYTPSADEIFEILDGPTTGRFNQINLPVLNNGLSWNTSNLGTNGTISVTPEPSTLTLLAAGGIGLMVAAWRRRKGRCSHAATASSEDNAPALLSFHSQPAQRTTASRRAA